GTAVKEVRNQSGAYNLLRTIKLLAWSADNSEIAALFYGDLAGTFLISIENDEIRRFLPDESLALVQVESDYAAMHLKLYGIDPNGINIFFSLPSDMSESSHSAWFISSFANPEAASEIQKPQDFVDDGTIDYAFGHAWSPDGKFLL